MTEPHQITAEILDAASKAKALATVEQQAAQRAQNALNMQTARKLFTALQEPCKVPLFAKHEAIVRFRATLRNVSDNGVKALCVLLGLDTAGDYRDRDDRLHTWAEQAKAKEMHAVSFVALFIDAVLRLGAQSQPDCLDLCELYQIEIRTP